MVHLSFCILLKMLIYWVQSATKKTTDAVLHTRQEVVYKQKYVSSKERKRKL